jgi:hypothetical protein
MTTEPTEPDRTAQPPQFEHVELDRRLRRLEWPGPSPEVKQRGLEAIRRAMEAESNTECMQAPVERSLSFEVTRWRPATHTMAWSAPRRQPRFAISL